MTRLGQDLKDALGAVRTSGGSSALVLLVLALGIGANAAVRRAVHAVPFRPLPVREPERLVRVFSTDTMGIRDDG